MKDREKLLRPGTSVNTHLTDLSAPIDVYSDWVDACDSVAKQAAQSTSQPRRDTYSGTASQSRSQATSDAAANTAADDGFIDDDELDAEADYADE
jgi:transcription elongation factor Elf1